MGICPVEFATMHGIARGNCVFTIYNIYRILVVQPNLTVHMPILLGSNIRRFSLRADFSPGTDFSRLHPETDYTPIFRCTYVRTHTYGMIRRSLATFNSDCVRFWLDVGNNSL